jgi:hypothetical protein
VQADFGTNLSKVKRYVKGIKSLTQLLGNPFVQILIIRIIEIEVQTFSQQILKINFSGGGLCLC